MRGMHLRWGGWLVMTYDLRIVCVFMFCVSVGQQSICVGFWF